MDIITHGLFAYSVTNSLSKIKKLQSTSILLGALIPDIGEIFYSKGIGK